MTAQQPGTNLRWQRVDVRVSYVLLAALLVAWAVLAVTTPTATHRTLSIDVTCASGNPAVSIWVESASGGSGWGQNGQPGSALARRFTFQQVFTGEYQVNVGCGGTPDQWGVVVESTRSEIPYRRLVCDDVHATDPSTIGGCRDEPAG